MKVKIGDTWYASTDTPICVQTTEQEHELIKSMSREGKGQFCTAKDGHFNSPDEMVAWMNDGYEKENTSIVSHTDFAPSSGE